MLGEIAPTDDPTDAALPAPEADEVLLGQVAPEGGEA